MKENTFCVLISGIDNLVGSDAIMLVDRFRLKEYGGVNVGSRGKYYYRDFSNVIDKENNAENLHSFIGLLQWFGLKKLKYRFDRTHLADSQIDFQLHMVQDTGYITIPRPKY